MKLRIYTLLLLISIHSFADNMEEIFLGTVDRSTLIGKRVTVTGRMEAKGCDLGKPPCKIIIKRKIKGALVFMTLTFNEKYAYLVEKKWIASPIVASCVYHSPFLYSDCKN